MILKIQMLTRGLRGVGGVQFYVYLRIKFMFKKVLIYIKCTVALLYAFCVVFGEKLSKARLTVHREPIRQRPYRTETFGASSEALQASRLRAFR